MMGWAENVAGMGEVRNAYKILIGKPESKRPLRRPRRRWEDNIRMYLREIGCEVVDWIHLAQDTDQWWALVNTVMNYRIP
jgi:ribosome biogenesis protein Nip4